MISGRWKAYAKYLQLVPSRSYGPETITTRKQSSGELIFWITVFDHNVSLATGSAHGQEAFGFGEACPSVSHGTGLTAVRTGRSTVV
jgi:hypothetical protein